MGTREDGPHRRAVVVFTGDLRPLMAWRARVADLTLAEAEMPRRAGGRWVLRVRLTADDLADLAAAQWPGDSGLDAADGRPLRWCELLACADMPPA